MPLIHSASDEARSENIRREVKAGKDPKQAAAIGYAEQRRMRGKRHGRKSKKAYHRGKKR